MILKELKSVEKKFESLESDYKLKFDGKWKKFWVKLGKHSSAGSRV